MYNKKICLDTVKHNSYALQLIKNPTKAVCQAAVGLKDNNDLRTLMYKLAEETLAERCKSIDELSSGEEFDIVKEIVRENVDIAIGIIPDITYTETELHAMATKLLSKEG